jgi:hypothetical protein
MIHVEITHLGKDDRGLRQPPFEWCAVKCDGCGALGPKELGATDFDTGKARAAAAGAGFVERHVPYMGRDSRGRRCRLALCKTFCAACVAKGRAA